MVTLTKIVKKDTSAIIDGKLAQELTSLIILPTNQELQKNLTVEGVLDANSVSIITISPSFLLSSLLFFIYHLFFCTDD